MLDKTIVGGGVRGHMIISQTQGIMDLGCVTSLLPPRFHETPESVSLPVNVIHILYFISPYIKFCGFDMYYCVSRKHLSPFIFLVVPGLVKMYILRTVL